MNRTLILCFLLTVSHFILPAQSRREDIYSEFTLYQKRAVLEQDIRERIIGKTFSGILDSNTEYRFETACNAISQFLFSSPLVDSGFVRMADQYDMLSFDTRKAFLEALYALNRPLLAESIRTIIEKESDPKLFAMCAVFLFRLDPGIDNSNFLKIKMVERFPGYDTLDILKALQVYIDGNNGIHHPKTPDIIELFKYQQSSGQKIIYSFQRWNRDYPGLAVVQNADGSFVKDASGKLQVFEQLARSGSGLPYFISNGNTPQGIYSIRGTNVAHNNFIGPTPNIQLIMPFENKWDKFFQDGSWLALDDSLQLYKQLLPPSWRNYQPMMETWNAGKIGRTEIIAHGTTIDPEFFKDKPFYPLTPTMGCLCAKELWNTTSGHLLVSEQFNLVSAFQSKAANKGYLIVVNVDDQQKAVTRAEIEAWVRKFENTRIMSRSGR